MVCQVNSSWCQFKKILEILTKSLQNRQKSFILLLEMLPDLYCPWKAGQKKEGGKCVITYINKYLNAKLRDAASWSGSSGYI